MPFIFDTEKTSHHAKLAIECDGTSLVLYIDGKKLLALYDNGYIFVDSSYIYDDKEKRIMWKSIEVKE